MIVEDAGEGMDAATRQHLFEPFFTTKPPGKGTGLGLPMVYGFVTQSGGTVHVRSAVGCGTAFTITLPRVDRLEAQPAPGPASPHEWRAARGARLLVVEDDAAIARLVRTVLGSRGYDVSVAGSAREALQKAGEDSDGFRMLLTDLVLPDVNGIELARQLKAKTPGLRILYMSGYGEHPGLASEAPPRDAHFVQKPFTPSALAEKVRVILESEAAPVSGAAKHDRGHFYFAKNGDISISP